MDNLRIRVLMVRLDGLTSSFDVEGDHMAACRETKRQLTSLWSTSQPVAKVFFAKKSTVSGWILEEVDVDAIRGLA